MRTFVGNKNIMTMLLKAKNPELFQEWLRWYEKFRVNESPAEVRTFAFIKSNNGEKPKW